jgi:small subunit ribosomal protein S1
LASSHLDGDEARTNSRSASLKSEKLLESKPTAEVSSRDPQTMEELLASVKFLPRGKKRGDVLEGTISSISGKEVLIDFGGKMEGIVGEKEWDVVKDFVARLKVGDKVPAVVISAENEKGQMIVSIRQAGSKFRWQKAQELLKSGEAVPVKGLEINKGGLIVEFEGIRGFIPGSQLTAEHQGEMAKTINRTISAKVIEVDQSQNRLIFSEKAVAGLADLTKKLEEVKGKVKINEKYVGKVSAVMPYGIFVNLENGADGLVHISEISWAKVDNLAENFKVGQSVDVLVLGISDSDAKLNLSLKQLLPDPWADLAKKYTPEQEIKGKVTRVSPYGIFVQLEEGVEGLIHISKASADSDYKVGDKVSCTIESIDSIAHRISLIPVLAAKPIGYK